MVADMAVRYTFCVRYTLCAHCTCSNSLLLNEKERILILMTKYFFLQILASHLLCEAVLGSSLNSFSISELSCSGLMVKYSRQSSTGKLTSHLKKRPS